MTKKKVPVRLWDYGLVWIAKTANITANSSRYANRRTPLEIITGITPDISEYLDFSFYDWVVFRAEAGLGSPSIGRWLGVSHKIGQQMSYWVLPQSGIPISVVTVQRLTNLEQTTDEWKARMEQYMQQVEQKMSSKSFEIQAHDTQPSERLLGLELEDDEFLDDYSRVINDPDLIEEDDRQTEDLHAARSYIGMEVGMPRHQERQEFGQ